MPVIVTGPRHSGTTFVMQIVQEMDYVLGEPLHSISPRQGLEWEPWRSLSSRAALDMGCKLEPEKGWSRVSYQQKKIVLEKYRKEIEELEWPEVVKMPEMGQSVLLPLIHPRHVFVCVRDPYGWAQSMKTQNGPAKAMAPNDLLEGMTQKIGWLIATLETHELPYTVIQYPRSARDVQYVVDRMGPLFGKAQVRTAWKKVVNARWDRR